MIKVVCKLFIKRLTAC